MENKVQCECAKCGGKGYIRGFEHVESGRCFVCGGSGKVWVEISVVYASEAAKAEAKADSARKRAWVAKADRSALERLPFSKLHAVHSFVAADAACGSEAMEKCLPLVQSVFQAACR